jgi:hypothetical protein
MPPLHAIPHKAVDLRYIHVVAASSNPILSAARLERVNFLA